MSARVSALSDKWPLSLKHNVDCYGRENDLPKCPADRRPAVHHSAGQQREVPSYWRVWGGGRGVEVNTS